MNYVEFGRQLMQATPQQGVDFSNVINEEWLKLIPVSAAPSPRGTAAAAAPASPGHGAPGDGVVVSAGTDPMDAAPNAAQPDGSSRVSRLHRAGGDPVRAQSQLRSIQMPPGGLNANVRRSILGSVSCNRRSISMPRPTQGITEIPTTPRGDLKALGFVEDLQRLNRADDVAIMMFTEFGRRVEEKARK